MPVEAVELRGGHAVEIALHELHGEKVAADVQVESPVAVAGVVLDLGAGDVTVGVGHLQERLEPVEDAAFVARREFRLVFGDAEPVSFGGDARAGVQLQEERVPRFPGRLLSVRGGQCRGYPDQPFGPGGEAFGGDFTAQGGEVPFAEFGPDGLRDELQGALRRGCAQRGQHGDQGE